MRATDWLALARPHQWIKNGFVLVGFLFAHRWLDTVLIERVAFVFVAFCLASSAVYALNDVMDREADRNHPRKRNRPVASGAIGVPSAVLFALALLAVALAFASRASPVAIGFVGLYALLNLVYSLGAKRVVVLDVFMIAAGFMLRLLAGTLGVGIAPSQWLVLCGLMITLFLGFVKRRAEVIALGGAAVASHRKTLEEYTPALLDNMITISAAGVIVTYSLYTVSPDTVALHHTDRLVFTLPFVLYGMFRYLLLLHARGGGGDPARDLLTDPHLAAAALGWLAVTFILIS